MDGKTRILEQADGLRVNADSFYESVGSGNKDRAAELFHNMVLGLAFIAGDMADEYDMSHLEEVSRHLTTAAGAAGMRTAAFKITKSDKAVIDAFIDGESGSSKHLTSYGRRLDGNWTGGLGIAVWERGKIHLEDKGSKVADAVQKLIRKTAPRSLIG